jgi:NADPH:quinone reductase-like Zn-dependent oxidoreductase
MRAAVRTGYGPPEVVHLADVPVPAVEEHDVRVRVHAATVNRTDCGFRSGKPYFARFITGFPNPRHSILGGEFAGVVEAVGAAVSRFAVGERVFGYSEEGLGAHAEYLAIAQDGPIATMPDQADFASIVPATEASHYAVGLVQATRIRRGDPVLVYGATGAIGSAAVQFLAYLGADVTAVCGPEHIDLVRRLGARRVIDRAAADFTQDDQKYRAVLDAVGKSSFGACRRLLDGDGFYLSTDLGRGGQNPILMLATAWSPGRTVSIPIPPRRDQAQIRRFKGLIEAGAFTPVVDRTYPLDDIVEAYRYVETGQKIGNVVIGVAPEVI